MIQNKKSTYKIFTPYILLIPSLIFSVGILFYPTIKWFNIVFLIGPLVKHMKLQNGPGLIIIYGYLIPHHLHYTMPYI